MWSQNAILRGQSELSSVCFFNFIFSGTYKPRIRCYDTYQLSLKFERCLDSDGKAVDTSACCLVSMFLDDLKWQVCFLSLKVVAFDILSDDYSKVKYTLCSWNYFLCYICICVIVFVVLVRIVFSGIYQVHHGNWLLLEDFKNICNVCLCFWLSQLVMLLYTCYLNNVDIIWCLCVKHSPLKWSTSFCIVITPGVNVCLFLCSWCFCTVTAT